MAAYRGLTVSYQNLFRLPLTYYHLSAKIYKLCFNSFKVLRGRIYKTSIIKNTPLNPVHKNYKYHHKYYNRSYFFLYSRHQLFMLPPENIRKPLAF